MEGTQGLAGEKGKSQKGSHRFQLNSYYLFEPHKF